MRVLIQHIVQKLSNPTEQLHKPIENRPKHSDYIKNQVNKDKTKGNQEANKSFNNKKNSFQNVAINGFMVKPTKNRNKTFIRINRKMETMKDI